MYFSFNCPLLCVTVQTGTACITKTPIFKPRMFCLVFLYAHFSLMKFLKWNVRGFAFSIILLRPHCWFCSICYVRIVVYPFFSHACFCWFTCSMYLCHVYCVHIASCCLSFRCVRYLSLSHS